MVMGSKLLSASAVIPVLCAMLAGCEAHGPATTQANPEPAEPGITLTVGGLRSKDWDDLFHPPFNTFFYYTHGNDSNPDREWDRTTVDLLHKAEEMKALPLDEWGDPRGPKTEAAYQ